MRTHLALGLSNLALVCIVSLPGQAVGQTPVDAAPAAPIDTAAPAPQSSAAPAAPISAPLAPTIAATSTTAFLPSSSPPEAVPPPAAAEEPAKPIPSYFRIDHDYLFGLQLWAGATYPLLDWLGLSTDIYIAENYPAFAGGTVSGGALAGSLTQSYWGEFDLGPALTLGPLSVTPMVGIAFDWAARRPVAINGPQLYTILNLDRLYFESWIWTLLYSPFKEPVASNYFHTRNWLLFKATPNIGIGPQFEYTYNLNTQGSGTKGTQAMPLGGHVELAYGTGNSLGLFLGYELDKDLRAAKDGKAAAGRLTFVHNF